MYGYKITYKEKEYVTNADSFKEAEEKFIDFLQLEEDEYSYLIDMDTVENLKELKNAVFF